VRATPRIAVEPPCDDRRLGRSFPPSGGHREVSKEPAHQPHRPGQHHQPQQEPQNPCQKQHAPSRPFGGIVWFGPPRQAGLCHPRVRCKLLEMRSLVNPENGSKSTGSSISRNILGWHAPARSHWKPYNNLIYNKMRSDPALWAEGLGGWVSGGRHRNALGIHIRTQNLREEDGAILLLIVFYQGEPSPPDGQA
jgi:hypothetical protein